MSPTVTKTKAPKSKVEQEAELRKVLDVATLALDETRRAAADHRGQISETRGHLNRRLAENPADFDSTGAAKPATGAAKLESKLVKLREADNFDRLIGAHGQRIAAAETALVRFRRDNADEMFAEGEAAADEWVAAVEALRVPYEKLVVLGQRAVAIATRSHGYNPRDVPAYEDLRMTIRALLRGRPPLPLPTLYVATVEAEHRSGRLCEMP